MAGADEFATELAEHAFIEIVLGEHASAPAVAGFEQNRLRAVLLQTIGSRQSGDDAADDGNRARSGLLGVSVPVQDGCERRRAAAAAESRNNCRLVSAEVPRQTTPFS
jgi:hypothetical protein